ncbi:MAG: hypothetical protein RL322_3126 [Pseudomonadota bacterium]|jgi:hypothetical protein
MPLERLSLEAMLTESERAVVSCDPEKADLGLRYAELAIGFLRTTEARDIEQARSMVGPGFSATFPRGRYFPSLDTWLESSKSTYVWIAKRFERIDVSITGTDSAIVHCSGTLHGERLDAKPLDGFRFIDRFVIREGRIVDQLVWNDLVP